MTSIDSRYEVRVGLASCSIAAGAAKVFRALEEAGASPHTAGCVGMCYAEPLVEILGPDGEHVWYGHVEEKDVERIVSGHLVRGEPVADLEVAKPDGQVRFALRNCGIVDPESIGSYIELGGYSGLQRALTMSPEAVIGDIRAAGLRGRGGAGFPTFKKWELAREAVGDQKYVVCNADEGDPGAFMDRSILESDPHSVIEGMMIAGYAIGASTGYVYVRAEYPLAIRRLRQAIAQAQESGYLRGEEDGSGFAFDIAIREGAGAFVCGEETALLMSIEGKRGMPRFRPPYPAEKGLFGCPTVINNVETLANVPRILHEGPESFAGLGTEKSRGTKVFSLAGKVRRGGLVEIPMGTTVNDIVFAIGGGISSGKPFKAVQTGGPSGGCIPAQLGDTPVDYESLAAIGAIMGSGGLLVMDADTCMVDVARYFLDFARDESCGKCTFCRVGTEQMLRILTRITEGRGEMRDLDVLEDLGVKIQQGSLCGLGQTVPNPVLTTLRFFRDEYEAHIQEQRCPAKQCKALIVYRILPDACRGCTLCEKACPVQAITGERGKTYTIDQERCIRCGLCISSCRFDAIGLYSEPKMDSLEVAK